MRLGIRARIFLTSFLLIVISVLAGEIYLVPTANQEALDRLRADYKVRLEFIADRAWFIELSQEKQVSWDNLADLMGQLSHARVTLIDPEGNVVGDSELDPINLNSVENHRDRPEVRAAMANQLGEDIRLSATRGKRMLYMAMRVPGRSSMVARLSVPLVEIDQAKQKVRQLLLMGALVAMVAALLVSILAAEFLTRRLRHVIKVAKRMAGGDLDVRLRWRPSDEIGELSCTLDNLAETASKSLRELRNDRDLLERILESMREGVLVMDSEHRILLANGSLKETLLLDSAVVGKSTIEVIRNADLQALAERALSTEQSIAGEIEIAGIAPRRMQVHASRLSGEPRALLLVLFDVTEMRRLETVRQDFVANVSHELRTPISAVQSAAETLRMAMGKDPVATEDFLAIIERNGRRLGELVSDLLDLSRIEAKDYRPQTVPVDIGSICQKVKTSLSAKSSARKMTVTIALPEPIQKPLGDPSAVERVLTNLVDNAIKYCVEGASITMTSGEEGGRVRISVRDSGPGIEIKHLPRLFERFYRVDGGRSRDMGGTGLGLSIVKHLVEAMKGEVSVESTMGKGSTFSFTLPK